MMKDLKYGSSFGRMSALDKDDRPNGHSFDNYYRADGYGSITTLVHPPVKGAFKLPTPFKSPKLPTSSSPFTGNRWRVGWCQCW
jgi:hypothetical protein